MKENIIFCDGGLANRLNTLIFGLILKAKFGGDWALSWPINNWCGARFESLFKINIPVYEKTLNYYKENEEFYNLIMHENQLKFNEKLMFYHKNLNTFEHYRLILEYDKPIIYYHNIIPSFVEIKDIIEPIKCLKVKDEILILAHSFCVANGINDDVLGLHIRKTDFGGAVNDDELFKLALNSSNKFFVCSDDLEVNRKFARLNNCCVYEKNFFPEKMIKTDGWNRITTDDQGRINPFNITRSSNSIFEALVDLLILSKTKQILTSHSTFLNMSVILKAVDFFNIDIKL